MTKRIAVNDQSHINPDRPKMTISSGLNKACTMCGIIITDGIDEEYRVRVEFLQGDIQKWDVTICNTSNWLPCHSKCCKELWSLSTTAQS